MICILQKTAPHARRHLAWVAAMALSSMIGRAQTPASIQSSARPLGLNIVAPVNAAGSDSKSAGFQSQVLPGMIQFLNQQLGERQQIDDTGILLDSTKLSLKTQSDVRVYFVGEGAGYANSLGFTTDGAGSANSPTAKLIFPNASSRVTSYNPPPTILRTANEPLMPGDFVDLGRMNGNTMLDFFLIANGASGGQTTFSTQGSLNPDGINHVVSFAYAMQNSPYLILGFEDLLGGGDRDFNDLIFAVDIGAVNIAALVATPEPATMATMAAFVGLGWVLVRKQRTASPSTQF